MPQPYPNLKLRPWKVIVNGVAKVISVLSSDVPDFANSNKSTGYQSTWDRSNAYVKGDIVRVTTATTYAGTTSTVGVFGAVVDIPANATGNLIPQFPEPTTGTVYWELISLGINVINTCQNGTKNIYIQSSTPF